MEHIKMILLAVLFYFTIIFWLLLLCTVDSYTLWFIIVLFIVGIILILICKATMTKDDIKKFTDITDDYFDEEV